MPRSSQTCVFVRMGIVSTDTGAFWAAGLRPTCCCSPPISFPPLSLLPFLASLSHRTLPWDFLHAVGPGVKTLALLLHSCQFRRSRRIIAPTETCKKIRAHIPAEPPAAQGPSSAVKIGSAWAGEGDCHGESSKTMLTGCPCLEVGSANRVCLCPASCPAGVLFAPRRPVCIPQTALPAPSWVVLSASCGACFLSSCLRPADSIFLRILTAGKRTGAAANHPHMASEQGSSQKQGG